MQEVPVPQRLTKQPRDPIRDIMAKPKGYSVATMRHAAKTHERAAGRLLADADNEEPPFRREILMNAKRRQTKALYWHARADAAEAAERELSLPDPAA